MCVFVRDVVGVMSVVIVLVLFGGEWIFVEMREGSHSFVLELMDVNATYILESCRLVDSQSLFGVSLLGIPIG